MNRKLFLSLTGNRHSSGKTRTKWKQTFGMSWITRAYHLSKERLSHVSSVPPTHTRNDKSLMRRENIIPKRAQLPLPHRFCLLLWKDAWLLHMRDERRRIRVVWLNYFFHSVETFTLIFRSFSLSFCNSSSSSFCGFCGFLVIAEVFVGEIFHFVSLWRCKVVCLPERNELTNVSSGANKRSSSPKLTRFSSRSFPLRAIAVCFRFHSSSSVVWHIQINLRFSSCDMVCFTKRCL